MGPCLSSTPVIKDLKQQNVNNPTRNAPVEPDDKYRPFEFDRTVISELQPKPIKIETNTKGDQLIPQGISQANGKYLEYDELLKQLGQGNFEDKIFPAQRSSISKDVNYKASKDITWKKPNQFLNQGKIMLFDNIEPMDIKQGELGDCYFLSSLSALAEIPEQIEKLFITKEYQQNGLYGIYMCHNGIFKQIVLDDYIPCHLQGGPIFSKTNGNELWVILLEKAYAKLYGSYHKIESGLSSCALKDLTGAPSEYFIRKGETLKDADLCWKFLKEFVPLNYIITASSEVNNKGVEFQNDKGIVSQHCYAILDIQDVTGSDSNQDRIIQIRNPWGRKEWTGDWSDNSHKWTQNLRDRLKVVKQDDGIFWISVRDFITEFSQVCVCKFVPSYKYSAIELSQVNSDQITTKVILMRVFNKTHGFVSIVQKDKRHFDKHAYSLARIIIGIIDPKTNKVLNYQGSAMDNERDLCVESKFEPGDYAVYIEVDWNQNYDRYLALSFYGQDGVQFSEMSVDNQQKGYILEGLLRVHEKFTEEEKVKDYGRNMKRISGIVAGYLYYWYQNQNPKDILKEEVTMNNIKYLEICPPQVNSNKFSVELKPYDNVFIKYRVSKEGNGSFGYSLSSANSIIENKSDEEIIQLALTHPLERHQRQQNGQSIEVYQYIVSYPGGIGIVYQNNTNMKYNETLQLKTQNLRGVGVDINSKIQIQVGPGKKYLIKMKSIDPTQQCSQSMEYQFSLTN